MKRDFIRTYSENNRMIGTRLENRTNRTLTERIGHFPTTTWHCGLGTGQRDKTVNGLTVLQHRRFNNLMFARVVGNARHERRSCVSGIRSATDLWRMDGRTSRSTDRVRYVPSNCERWAPYQCVAVNKTDVKSNSSLKNMLQNVIKPET